MDIRPLEDLCGEIRYAVMSHPTVLRSFAMSVLKQRRASDLSQIGQYSRVQPRILNLLINTKVPTERYLGVGWVGDRNEMSWLCGAAAYAAVRQMQ